MEVSKPKWVKPNGIWYGVNSLRLRGLQFIKLQHITLRSFITKLLLVNVQDASMTDIFNWLIYRKENSLKIYVLPGLYLTPYHIRTNVLLWWITWRCEIWLYFFVATKKNWKKNERLIFYMAMYTGVYKTNINLQN